MKQILVQIDDDVWRELRSAMMVRRLSCPSPTIVDEFTAKLLQAIEQGKEKKHFFYNKPQEGTQTVEGK